MRKPRKDLLMAICTLGRITRHHYTDKRRVSSIGTKGAHRLRNISTLFVGLEKTGMIEKALPIMKEHKDRWQYYEATDKGHQFLNFNLDRSYGFFSVAKNPEHQHGLMTVLMSLYFAHDGLITVEHAPKAEKYGYKVDAVVHVDDGPSYFVEFESSKGFNEVVSDIRARDKKLVLPKNGKVLYVINNTRNANKNSRILRIIPPSEIHDEPDPNMERKTEKFLADLLYELKDLPSWKYRFQALHNFEKFGEGIWLAPGKNCTFKLN